MADPYADWKVDPTFKPEKPAPQGYEDWKVDPSFKPQVSPGMDVLRGVGSGLATGVAGIPGVLGDVTSLANVGINKLSDVIGSALGYSPEEIEKTKAHGSPFFPTTERVKEMTGLNKADYEPQTRLGRYARSISEFVPGAATGGAGTVKGIVGNVAKFGVAPGVASEFAGEQLPGAPGARVVAGLLAPALAHGIMSPGRVLAGTPATEKAYAEHVAKVKAEGIPVSPAEEQGSLQLKYAERALDPQGYIKNREAFTRAATRKVGKGEVGETHETPTIEHGQGGTLDKMLSEIGDRYDALNARNSFKDSPDFIAGMHKVQQTYNAHPGIYGQDTVNAVNGWIDRIDRALLNAPKPGQLAGPDFHVLLKDLRAKRMNAPNSREEEALHQIEEQLTTQMERSVRPEDRGAYKRTDKDYKNALVLMHAISRAGNETHLTPAGIVAAAKNVYSAKAFERGASPFDFATSANHVLRMVPDSGTAHHAIFPMINAALGQTAASGAGLLFGHATGMHDPIGALLTLEHLGTPLGILGLPAIEKPGYKLLSPYFRNRTTRFQDPLLSLPGLLTAIEAQRQGENR